MNKLDTIFRQENQWNVRHQKPEIIHQTTIIEPRIATSDDNDNKALQAESVEENTCISEFERFLDKSVKFIKFYPDLYRQFQTLGYDDIRFIFDFDEEILEPLNINPIFRKTLIDKIEALKSEATHFQNWLNSVLDTHVQHSTIVALIDRLENEGILTFESFRRYIFTKKDLLDIIGREFNNIHSILWHEIEKVDKKTLSTSVIQSDTCIFVNLEGAKTETPIQTTETMKMSTTTKTPGLTESDLQLMMDILHEHAYPEMSHYFQKRNVDNPLSEYYKQISQYFIEKEIDNNKFTSVTKTSFVHNISSFIGEENSDFLKQSLGQLYTVIDTNNELQSVLTDFDKKISSIQTTKTSKYNTEKPDITTKVSTSDSIIKIIGNETKGILIHFNDIHLTINHSSWLSIFEYDNLLLFKLSPPYRILNLLKLIDSFSIRYSFINNNYQPITCPQPSNNNQQNTGGDSSAGYSNNNNNNKTSQNGSNSESTSNNFNSNGGSGNGGRDNDDNNHNNKSNNTFSKLKPKKKKKPRKNKNENEYDEQELLDIISQHERTIAQQRQVITSLQKSHQTLIDNHQNPKLYSVAMHAMQDVCKYQQENLDLKIKNNKLQKLLIPNNNDKKKKKKARKQNKRNEMELKNDEILNYEPQSSLRAQGNIQIPRKLTNNGALQIEEDIANLFNYLDKFTAMINVDKQEEKRTIMDYELHEKNTGEKLYCVLETQDPILKSNRGYKCKMKNKFFTQKELNTVFNICEKELPLSITSDIYFIVQLQSTNVAQKLLSNKSKIIHIINSTMWQNVRVLTKRDQNRRVTLSLTTSKLKQNMNSAIKKIDNINLIPIIMFKNDKYFVNNLWIIRIDENIDIGISFGYNIQNKNIFVTAIHMDKIKIIEQIKLMPIKYRNIYAEKCLNEFTSNVTHLSIGNPQDDQNTINNYKLKYEKFKQFTETLSESNSINAYEQLKLHAKLLLLDNNYICNYLPSSPIADVAFSSESAISRSGSVSLSSTSSLCGYPLDHSMHIVD